MDSRRVGARVLILLLLLGALAPRAVSIAAFTAGGRVLPDASNEKDGSHGVSLDYVDGAVLPLARDVIKAFRHAKPSRRHVERHTSEMGGMSYRNVTEISVVIPARVAFKGGHVARAFLLRPRITIPVPTPPPNHPHKGKYTYAADFKGPIKPNNLVAISIGTNQDTRNGGGIYGFELGKTTNDGPTNATPMHWLMTSSYGSGSRWYGYDSCSIAGGPGGFHPVMSVPILTSGINQAESVLRQAEKHRPIKQQKDVFASQEPAHVCP